MTLDTTALAYLFKQVYGDIVTDLFPRQVMTWNLFDESSRKATYRPAGAGYYFPVRQADEEGQGARAEGALLPAPLAGDGTQGTILPKLNYHVIRMSGLALEAGMGADAAFVEAQTDATKNAYNALVNDLNRQCHGDGYGLLATLSTTSDSLSTSATWTVTCNNDRGVRYLKKGMIVDFYESTAIDQSSITSRISSINPTTKVVTMEANAAAYQAYHPLAAARNNYTIAAGTIASGAFMVRYGARLATHATSNASYELTGLEGMYDDGTSIATFEGITVANDPEWKANMMGNGSVDRNLSIDLMLAAMDMTSARSTAQADIIRMGIGQRRKYYSLLAPDIRFTPGELKGGYERLNFSQNAAVQIIVDPVTQPGRLYFEPKDCIKRYELTKIGWGGFDANKMHWREGYDQATMFLRLYANLGVENRPALTKLYDLTEPSSMPF